MNMIPCQGYKSECTMYALHVLWESDIEKQCSIMYPKDCTQICMGGVTQDQHSWVTDGKESQWKGNESSWNWIQFLCCIFGRLQNQCVSQNPLAPSNHLKCFHDQFWWYQFHWIWGHRTCLYSVLLIFPIPGNIITPAPNPQTALYQGTPFILGC